MLLEADGTTSGLFTDRAQIPNGLWKPITTPYKLENFTTWVLEDALAVTVP